MSLRLLLAALCLIAGLPGAEIPSPALLVVNKGDSNLAIVDPRTNQTIAKIPTGNQPHEVAVSSDGRQAFVSNYGGSTPGSSISVIDLMAQTAREIPLNNLRRPHGIVFQGGKVYFTAEDSGQVARFDPKAGRVDLTIPSGQSVTHMVLVAPDSKRMFSSNIGSNSVSIYDSSASAQWMVQNVATGRGPEGFDVSPDGKQLWAANSQDGSVSIVDIGPRKVIGTIEKVTGRSNRLKFTPDGKQVLISDITSGELVIVDVAKKQVAGRVKVGQSPTGILILPAGDRAYVAASGDNEIVVVDLKSQGILTRFRPGSNPDGMAWAVRP